MSSRCAKSRRGSADVREVDTVARFGGAEYIAVLSELCSRADAQGFAATILREIGLPVQIDGARIHIGASIGSALARGTRVTTNESTRRADDAMFHAMRAGRNC